MSSQMLRLVHHLQDQPAVGDPLAQARFDVLIGIAGRVEAGRAALRRTPGCRRLAGGLVIAQRFLGIARCFREPAEFGERDRGG